MGVSSALPTSRRLYLSQDELAQFANITITDTTEADDRISQAEEMIDAYVGFQEMFFPVPVTGRAASGGSSSITLESSHQNVYEADYFKWCQVEIMGGTGEGQRRTASSSTKAGVLTLQSAWTTAPDSTSFYKITQVGKFPRHCDVEYYSTSSPYKYYKVIPEAVKRAVAAQIEFLINMGDNFFNTDKAEKQSEAIGDYSYTGTATGATEKLISPKAKLLLRGIKNRVGVIV